MESLLINEYGNYEKYTFKLGGTEKVLEIGSDKIKMKIHYGCVVF
jgi:hypothetical protein